MVARRYSSQNARTRVVYIRDCIQNHKGKYTFFYAMSEYHPQQTGETSYSDLKIWGGTLR